MSSRAPLSIPMCVPLGLLCESLPVRACLQDLARALVCSGHWAVLETFRTEPGTKAKKKSFVAKKIMNNLLLKLSACTLPEVLQPLLRHKGKCCFCLTSFSV